MITTLSPPFVSTYIILPCGQIKKLHIGNPPNGHMSTMYGCPQSYYNHLSPPNT
jgi:hypothetical protein